MTAWGMLLVALQSVAQGAPSAPSPDSLLDLAASASPAVLAELARRDPAGFREAVATALRRSVGERSASGSEDTGALDLARRLAAAHASVWDDPFLPRQIQRFAAHTREWRREKLRADSLRRAGAEVLGREGTVPAIALWRESLALASELADTASMAAAMQNLGGAFLRESSLDSAEVWLLGARALAASVGDRVVQGNALGALHFVSFDRGDLVQARARLEEAMTLRSRIGDRRGAAADLNSLGLLAWDVGDLAGARRDFEAALELNRRERRPEVAATNLTNLAALAGLEGDFARALALYGEALATYRSGGAWPDVADVLWGLGQLEARRGDYPRARDAFVEALTIYERTGPVLDAMSLRLELAGVLAAMGEVQGAIDALRRAEDEAAAIDAPPDARAGAALVRADLHVALNSLAEAEREYGLAERLYAEAGDVAGQAEARQGQGLLLLEREDFVRAGQVLGGAAQVQEANENRRGAALTRTLMARARSEQGDLVGARALLRQSVAELERLEDVVAQAFALGALADLEAEGGRPLAADSAYGRALGLIEDRRATEVRWRLHFGRGLAARSTGALDVAVRDLRAAVAEVERTASGLALAERRSAYHADKAEVYAQLALTEHMRGRVSAAFDATERLRAREALEMLARGRTSPPSGIAGDLAAREHDLRVRIAELTRDVEPMEPGLMQARGPRSLDASGAALERLTRAREEYGELLLEMRERAPREAELHVPRSADWRDVARRLTPGTALIEYLLTDSGSVAFVVTSDTLGAVELGVRRRDVARLVEFSRATIESLPHAGDTQWQGPLRRLHEYLIAPAEDTGLLHGVSRLVLVPHAELHYVSFAALLDQRGSYLVERYALGFAPSASVWLALGDRPTGSSRGGVLALAPSPQALPASGREVAAVTRLARGDARLLMRADASEAALRRLASEYRVLHLATYGVLNRRNPLFSFVDLSAGGGHDGRLEVHEVFGLELAADLVVLSACQTGLGSGALADVPEGDDWIGLTRAFLHAGANRVVATLWAVEDEASAALMERFYEARARGSDDMTSLAQAQRRLLREPSSAHPFYWAAVVLVGEQEGADAR
jgi:CHAT domain-containing protein